MVETGIASTNHLECEFGTHLKSAGFDDIQEDIKELLLGDQNSVHKLQRPSVSVTARDLAHALEKETKQSRPNKQKQGARQRTRMTDEGGLLEH